MQHAASVCALTLLQEHRATELQARVKRELVEGLLLGRPDEAQTLESARLLGLDVGAGEHRVLAIAPVRDAGPEGGATEAGRSDVDRHILDALALSLDLSAPGVVAVARGDCVTVILPLVPGGPAGSAEGSAGDLHRELPAFLQHRLPAMRFTIGMSRSIDHPRLLPRAHEEARRALALATVLGRLGEVVSFEDLGIYRLLSNVGIEHLRGFVDEVLGPAIAYDRGHSSRLVETLDAYLRANSSSRHAASRLFVHVNTVTYRVRRAETIIGRKMDDADDRLLVLTALKVLDLVEGEQRGE
ncbi:MAG TPA: helix-turn-helix domain-containing protein [Acidimicrobiales bacterium]|nr:helix-turn-helix domain-containing protein [Acidimicrobiales bacterium]